MLLQGGSHHGPAMDFKRARSDSITSAGSNNSAHRRLGALDHHSMNAHRRPLEEYLTALRKVNSQHLCSCGYQLAASQVHMAVQQHHDLAASTHGLACNHSALLHDVMQWLWNATVSGLHFLGGDEGVQMDRRTCSFSTPDPISCITVCQTMSFNIQQC